MFYNCKSLSFLPDISKWSTQNVTNISYIFSFYSSLSLPEFSKGNIHNATNINSMFYNCKSLSSLPDISKWTANSIISGCFNLIFFIFNKD